MKLIFKHGAAGTLLVAFVVSQSGFAFHVGYCIEYFQLENGSTCSMAMMERPAGPVSTEASLLPSNSCCATKSIEANKRYRALLKDAKPTEKVSTVLFVVPATEDGLQASYYRVATDRERHSHSPPLNQLIITSTILLI